MKDIDKPTDRQVTGNTDLNKKADAKDLQHSSTQRFAQNSPQWEPTDKESPGKGYEEEGV